MDGPSRPPVATDISEGIINVSQMAHELERRTQRLLDSHFGNGAPAKGEPESAPDPTAFVPMNMVRLQRTQRALEGLGKMLGEMERSYGVERPPETNAERASIR